jgi:hypothetical protein
MRHYSDLDVGSGAGEGVAKAECGGSGTKAATDAS